MRAIKVSAGCLLVIFLTGCAGGIGRPFNTSFVERIERGRTTKQEVRANLGEPNYISRNQNGEIWNYTYQQGPGVLEGWMYTMALGNMTAKSDSLTIMFVGDYVNDYHFTRNR